MGQNGGNLVVTVGPGAWVDRRGGREGGSTPSRPERLDRRTAAGRNISAISPNEAPARELGRAWGMEGTVPPRNSAPATFTYRLPQDHDFRDSRSPGPDPIRCRAMAARRAPECGAISGDSRRWGNRHPIACSLVISVLTRCWQGVNETPGLSRKAGGARR